MPDSMLDDLPGGDVKIGGRSIYVYGAVIGAVVVLYLWWNGRSSNTSVASTNVDGQEYITVPGLSGDLGDLPKATEIDPEDYDTPEETNAQWMVKAMAWLATQGISPLKAQVAIQKYFDGEQLDYDQTTLMNKAVGQFGPPPQGLYGPPLITPDRPSAPAVSVPTDDGAGVTPPVPAPLPAPVAAVVTTPHIAKYVVDQGTASYFDTPGGNVKGTEKKGATVTTAVKRDVGGKRWVGTAGGRWFREEALRKA